MQQSSSDVRRGVAVVAGVLLATFASAGGLSTNSWWPDHRLTANTNSVELPALVALPNGALGVAHTLILQSEVDAEAQFSVAEDFLSPAPYTVVAARGSDKACNTLAVDNWSRVHYVYADSQPGNFELFHRQSDNSGATWSAPNRLTTASNQSWNPTVACRNTDVYCIWDDNRAGIGAWSYHPVVYFRRSLDRGTTWEPDVRVSDEASSYSWNPRLLVDNAGTVHALWHDKRDGALELYYDYSTDRGATWHTDTRITPDDDDDSAIAAWTYDSSRDRIHLLWRDTPAETTIPGLYHARSVDATADGVQTWTSPVRRFDYGSVRNKGYVVWHGPSCAIVDGVLHVVWSDYISVDTPGGRVDKSWVYWAFSRDGGASWSPRYVLSQGNSVKKDATCIPWRFGLAAAWSDDRDGNLEIYGKYLNLVWDGAVEIQDGWCYLNWFGCYNITLAPWIYHAQHGWMYPYGSSTDNLTLWEWEQNAFLWTDRSVYPWLYRFSDNCWVYYHRGTDNPRWFWNNCNHAWETR